MFDGANAIVDSGHVFMNLHPTWPVQINCCPQGFVFRFWPTYPSSHSLSTWAARRPLSILNCRWEHSCSWSVLFRGLLGDSNLSRSLKKRKLKVLTIEKSGSKIVSQHIQAILNSTKLGTWQACPLYWLLKFCTPSKPLQGGSYRCCSQPITSWSEQFSAGDILTTVVSVNLNSANFFSLKADSVSRNTWRGDSVHLNRLVDGERLRSEASGAGNASLSCSAGLFCVEAP